MKRPVFLNDTTLRDGAQAPGVAFTTAMGADEIEAICAAGALRLPIRLTALAVSKLKLARSWRTICTISCVCTEKYSANPVLHDTKLLQRVTRQRSYATKAWCRMRSEDLNAAIESGIAAVNLSLPASDVQLTAKLGLDQAGALQVIEHMVARVRRKAAQTRSAVTATQLVELYDRLRSEAAGQTLEIG